MKTSVIIGLIGIACFFFTINTNAQFELSGEFRPRTEYSHGYNKLALPNQEASLFTSQRTRLNFIYSMEKVKTSLTLQDVRIWGNQAQLIANEDFATSIHEAWLEYEFLPGFSLKFGRQELVYNDHRIFGNVGWAQQGRSHDLFLFKYEKGMKFHAGLAYNENSERNNNFYNGPDAYKAMQFLWINKANEKLDISLLFLNNGVGITLDTTATGDIAKQGISYSQTFGPVASYKIGKFKLSGSFYLQSGQDASEKDINAYYSNLELSHPLSERFSASLAYEILSGTSYDELEKNHSFTPFYGTNHKFNGFMDYFYTGNHINNVGLNDINLKLKYNFKKLSLSSAFHYFTSDKEIEAGSDPYLGTEIDLSLGVKLEENVLLNLGYSQMFAGESMELLKLGSADETQNWFYIMISVKPKFLVSK